MVASVVYILLFILPFIILPFGISEFETPKVIIAEAGILLLFFIALWKRNSRLQPSRLQMIFLSTIVVLTFIDLLFFRSSILFFGNAFRMQGIFLLWLLLLFSVVSAGISFSRIPYYVFGLCLLIEVVAMFFLPLNESQRYVGTIGEPNALAAFAVFLWPFAYFAVKKWGIKEYIFLISLVVLVITILILTGSRSAMIALGIQIIFILLYHFRLTFIKIWVICFALVILTYLLPSFQRNPYENRAEIWRAGVAAGYTKPLIGWGFGNIENAMKIMTKKINVPVQYYYVDSAHNIFLDWYIAGGFVGLISLIGLLITAGITFIQQKNARNCVLLLGMIVVLSFNPASIVGLLNFWWLIGQGYSYVSKY